MESKVSVVTMTLPDIRSGVQLAHLREGNATKPINFGAAWVPSAPAAGGLGQTPEGKATVAAVLDARQQDGHLPAQLQGPGDRNGLDAAGS